MKTLQLRLARLMQRRIIAMLALLLSGLIGVQHPAFAQANRFAQASYDGTVGDMKVGMTLALDGNTVTRAHYFYYRHLKDIALTGTQSGSKLTLKEASGTFNLHFVGNGSNGSAPLDFPNSVGLEGTWTDGSKTLPVKLSGGGDRSSVETPAGPQYGAITSETDQAFEARAQGFYFAALKGDARTAARYVDYPLRVNWTPTHHELIKSPKQLVDNWNRIFTPNYIAALRDAAPHDMPVMKSEYAMLGAGLAYFSDKGVEVLNVP
jgi:hypothetical protein